MPPRLPVLDPAPEPSGLPRQLLADRQSPAPQHHAQVCGLEWSPDDRELASGGNDNQLLVWGNHGVQPQLRFSEHNAAVKAISWSPHQHGLLASGGGTADRCIRFWNTVTGSRAEPHGHRCLLGPAKQACQLQSSKDLRCSPASAG